MVRSAPFLLTVLIIAGCQSGSSDKLQTTAPRQANAIEGSYRLKATPDEVVEAGGVENLPQLIIANDHWRIIAGDTESSGTWQYSAGKLDLTDKESGETTSFRADATATELEEIADDPIIFAKFGVTEPTKPAK